MAEVPVVIDDEMYASLQDMLEDIYCGHLQTLGIHKRGRCVALASIAVGLFKERVDALVVSQHG